MFIGSVFSPYYAWSGRRHPHEYCCVNVATYGPGGQFTMTERRQHETNLHEDFLQIGRSSIKRTNQGLEIHIDEWAGLPRPGRVRGKITLDIPAITSVAIALTNDGAHQWRPFAPRCRIQVELNNAHWQGEGYFDANFGTRMLEDDFDFWTWGRFAGSQGTYCIYDAKLCQNTEFNSAFLTKDDGQFSLVDAPEAKQFDPTFWRVPQETRADRDSQPKRILPMLDAPFYSRNLVRTSLHGEQVVGVHEALDLTRLRRNFVKTMLAMRIWRSPMARAQVHQPN